MILKKLSVSLLLVNLIFLLILPVGSLEVDSSTWDNDWSFKQEIVIPIDTSTEIAKHQPIDTRIEFDNLCWAKNEKKHSVRVVFQENRNLKEIESQIYDLNYSDDNHIEACSLVFLIPEDANGNERYYVYYDEHEKSGPNYPDRVEIKESYYQYEPFPGYFLKSNHYEISEDGFVVYAVAQDGNIMGKGIAQQVTKLKSKSDKVVPSNGEVIASFDFWYYYGTEVGDYSSTIERLISKEIFVDGNLMIEFGIISGTYREDIQTTAIYKYYYCPNENRSIFIHVKHDTLKECRVTPNANYDGMFASINCGGIRSNAIKELNFGKIFPYLHVYTEDDIIREYRLDPDPQYNDGNWDISIVDTRHDVDLGNKTWVSFDEGQSGIAHALILSSNSVVKSGTDERDGIQLKVYESGYPNLPGIENKVASLQLGRNSYEKGFPHDLEISEGFTVEFDVEFFSTEIGGYQAVKQEADIFQKLSKIRPSQTEEITENIKEKETYSLTIFLHIAPSVPMGFPLSVLTGKNLSYISAELYHNENIMSTGIARRISTNPLPSFDDTTLIQKIKLALGIFDWENLTFFKKLRFQNLEPGRYLVKIYKENPTIGKDRKYIGFTIVDVQEDTKTRVFCKPERSVYVNVFDQNEEGVKDAKVILLKDDTPISKSITDDNGQALIKAPSSILSSYNLKVLYNGFVIHEEPVKLRSIRTVVPIKKSMNIERYHLTLKILDTWGLPPEIDLNPVLTSKEMAEPTVISAEKLPASNFLFSNLIPANYQLNLQYKSFSEEQNIEISSDEKINLVFPAEFNIKVYTFNSRGTPLKDANIMIIREGNKVQKNGSEKGLSQFSLPPGNYKAEVYLDENLISERKINVISERTFNLITTEEPIFPIIIICSSAIFLLIGTYLTLRKKEIKSFLKIFAITLAIISTISPWWILHGSVSNVETTTSMFLHPVNLVTLTVSQNVIGGDIEYLPEIFVHVMSVLPLLTIVSCLFLIVSIVFNRYGKKRFSLLSTSSAGLILVASLVLFSITMSEFAKVDVGDFIGQGNVNIVIPGEGTYEALYCSWGPAIGFYLYILSAIIILIIAILNFKRNLLSVKLLSKKNFNKAKKILPFIGITIFIFLIYSLDVGEIIDAFLSIPPIYIIISVFLTIPVLIIRNYAWQLVQKEQKIKIPYFRSLKIHLIGYFYGTISPGYIGQLIKVPHMKEYTGEPYGKLFINVFIDSVLRTLSLYIMMVIGGLIIIGLFPELFYITVIWIIILSIILLYFIKKERGEKLLYSLVRYFTPKKLRNHLNRFIDTFYKDFPSIKRLIFPLILGAFTWIIIFTQEYIIVLALGLNIPYLYFLLLYPIANAAGFIPISFAGLGVREYTAILLFSTFFSIEGEKIFVLSIMGFLITTVLKGFIGFLLSLTETRKTERIRHTQ